MTDENHHRLGEFIVTGVAFLLGIWVIYVSNWNFILLSLGSLFSLAPVLQIPQVRIYINRKTGRQIFNVSENPFERSFHLKAGRYTRKYSWKLKQGERLVGEVGANQEVSVYVLDLSSLWDFQYNNDFHPLWEAEDVTHASVSFTAPRSGKFHLIVTNEAGDDYYEDEEREEDVLVHVRMRTDQ